MACASLPLINFSSIMFHRKKKWKGNEVNLS